MKFFVYGTLKTGFRLNRYLAGARSLGEAETVDADFQLYDLGPYPAVRPRGDAPGVAIRGELFVGPAALRDDLDDVEGYPDLYDRRLVTVRCGGQLHDAWMYVYADEPCDAPRCPSGAWPDVVSAT